MRRLLTVLAAGAPLAASVYLPSAAAAPLGNSGAPRAACVAPSVKAPAGAEVESVTAARRPGGTVHGSGVLGGTVTGVPAYCEVTVTLTHPGADDHAKVRTWLPAAGWNGRFQAFGGSGYAAGDNGVGLATAVKNGYAATTTDAGVGDVLDVGWGLRADGRVNTALLKNFASRSQHEAAVVGKRSVAAVYGRRAAFSYFNGCSTGGRQGYMEAQRHPDDYDGILANAPAVHWDEFEVATLWPQVVMNNEKTYPSSCTFKAFTDAAVKACDPRDGVEDGLVNDAARCDFDPRRLIGTKVLCDGRELTVTAADAAVVRKIWDGPRTASGKKLWPGVPVGADLTGLAAVTEPDAHGNVKGEPFPVPRHWVATWVKKQPSYDVATITYDRFTRLFRQSQAEYDKVIGTDDPDLSAFRKSGGKLLSWHGQADQFIPVQGTVEYREQVERTMGGAERVDDFHRLFLAPGTTHCGLNKGNGATDDLGALRTWVERGKAPDVLPATLVNAQGRSVTRDLCAYPQVSRYRGHGDPDEASSFRCEPPRTGQADGVPGPSSSS
ncbi:tannase/feruloyl esterase family alpha/beta hydrolase [Streptomyces sp. NRRL B-1347]|uniref:tannase/feruloyl esterase family alpha/beta hydrolase n=1 Tax=Streptomyces sp. NRRL B-1347 TaxID=1476877 RepID=UPI00068FE215|nr:tannase/feruloyl esterase family alpha/beta hydrolase [Streptomyces sp. NRRL B-1347]